MVLLVYQKIPQIFQKQFINISIREKLHLESTASVADPTEDQEQNKTETELGYTYYIDHLLEKVSPSPSLKPLLDLFVQYRVSPAHG